MIKDGKVYINNEEIKENQAITLYDVNKKLKKDLR